MWNELKNGANSDNPKQVRDSNRLAVTLEQGPDSQGSEPLFSKKMLKLNQLALDD